MPDLTPINLSLKLVSANAAPMDVGFAPFFKGDPGAPGEAGSGGMPADVRANMSKLEGKHTLRDLYAALANYHNATGTGNPSGFIGIGCWGDSVSSHVWSQFILLLLQSYGQGGMAMGTANGVPGMSQPVLTGTFFDSGAAPISQTVFDGTGGFADFTYLPGGDHIRLSNAATLRVDAGASYGWATARVYLAKGVGMGSAKVDLLDLDDGDAQLATQTVSLSDTQLGLQKVQFTCDPTKAYKIRVTATGTVIYLRGGLFKAYGIVPMSFGRGGSIMSQQNHANTAILSALLTDLNVKLMFVQAKEENAAVNVPAMFARFAGLPAFSKIVVGSLPDNGDAASLQANNAIFRTQALANEAAYFDGYSACKDFAELTRLGWQGDGVHPADAANRFVAGMILGELDLMTTFGTAEFRDVRSHRMIGQFYIEATTGVPSLIMRSYGGSESDKALIMNIAQLLFGPEGSAASLQQRTSNSVQVIAANGDLGSLFIGNIEQADAGQQNYYAGRSVFDREIILPEHTVATLPNYDDRAIVFASNGRKVGETAGNGTGVYVYRDGATWRVFSTDQPVQE